MTLTPNEYSKFAVVFREHKLRCFKANKEWNEKNAFKIAIYAFCEASEMNEPERISFFQAVGGNWNE